MGIVRGASAVRYACRHVLLLATAALFTNCTGSFKAISKMSEGPTVAKKSIKLGGDGIEGYDYEGCIPKSTIDFFDNLDKVKLLPRDCAIIEMNPPLFSWSDHPRLLRDPNAPWNLEIVTEEGAAVDQFTTTLPYGPLGRAQLKPGAYKWRVTYKNADGKVLSSDFRKFQIPKNSSINNLLSETEFFSRVMRKAHPRALPDNLNLIELKRRAGTSENRPFYERLIGTASNALSRPLLPSPESKSPSDFPSYAAYKAWLVDLKRQIRFEVRDGIALAFV